MRDSKLGDEMPSRRNVKWGSMDAGNSHLSDEWHDMERSSGHMNEKWIDQEPSKGYMSDKWIDMEAGNSPDSDKWHTMKQEGREDPYQMAPSSGDREGHFKPMAKVKADGGKVNRSTQHTEFGSTREL